MNFYQILRNEKIREWLKKIRLCYTLFSNAWTISDKLKEEIECFSNIDLICYDAFKVLSDGDISAYLKELNRKSKTLYYGRQIVWRLANENESLEIMKHYGDFICSPFWIDKFKFSCGEHSRYTIKHNVFSREIRMEIGKEKNFVLVVGVIKNGERE